ncbi:MAG: hypothetical protein PQJ44_01805 [Sphaerochaetaceae bacterium]|nr:hypothetical protein [Sphaerochaetaceae bacterium]
MKVKKILFIFFILLIMVSTSAEPYAILKNIQLDSDSQLILDSVTEKMMFLLGINFLTDSEKILEYECAFYIDGEKLGTSSGSSSIDEDTDRIIMMLNYISIYENPNWILERNFRIISSEQGDSRSYGRGVMDDSDRKLDLIYSKSLVKENFTSIEIGENIETEVFLAYILNENQELHENLYYLINKDDRKELSDYFLLKVTIKDKY